MVLRAVIGLTDNLPKKDLEIITGEAIRTHRRLRDEAEALFPPYGDLPPNASDSVGVARLAWVSAMIQMHAQQTVVSTLLEVLGYVPDVPDGEETARRSRSA